MLESVVAKCKGVCMASPFVIVNMNELNKYKKTLQQALMITTAAGKT